MTEPTIKIPRTENIWEIEGWRRTVRDNLLPKPYESTMTGHETFTYPNRQQRVYLLDPDGTGRNFNPSGSFPKGYQAIVVNTGSGAADITFDSTGIAETISNGNKTIFIYTGSTWIS